MKKLFSFITIMLLIATLAYAERLIVFEDQYLKVALSNKISKASIKEVRRSIDGKFRVIEASPDILKQEGIKYIVDKKIFRKANGS